MYSARRFKRISDPLRGSVVERYFAQRNVADIHHLPGGSGKIAGMPSGITASLTKRRQVTKTAAHDTVVPVGPSGPNAGVADSTGLASKGADWELDEPEVTMPATEEARVEESSLFSRPCKAVGRDADEEEEWAELAMTVKLCLASAGPAEIILEERIKDMMGSSTSSSSSSAHNASPESPTMPAVKLVPLSPGRHFTPHASPCGSPSRDTSADERLRVAASLAVSRQHDVVLCHAAWPNSYDSPSGEYDFLEISSPPARGKYGDPGSSPTSVLAGSPFSSNRSRSPYRNQQHVQHQQSQQNDQQQRAILLPAQRVVVDVAFRQQFEVARPTPRYAELLAQLPTVFVGVRQRLRPLVTAMATALNLSLQTSGMDVAPWRRVKYLTSKWFPTTDAGAAIPESRTAILPAVNLSSPDLASEVMNNTSNGHSNVSITVQGSPVVDMKASGVAAQPDAAAFGEPSGSAFPDWTPPVAGVKHRQSVKQGSLSLCLRPQRTVAVAV